jgi:hypothetical protein
LPTGKVVVVFAPYHFSCAIFSGLVTVEDAAGGEPGPCAELIRGRNKNNRRAIRLTRFTIKNLRGEPSGKRTIL